MNLWTFENKPHFSFTFHALLCIRIANGMNVFQYFEDYKLKTPTSVDASYRTEFMFYLGIVSQVSNAVISFINTFFQFGK